MADWKNMGLSQKQAQRIFKCHSSDKSSLHICQHGATLKPSSELEDHTFSAIRECSFIQYIRKARRDETTWDI
jgi:hypothetical protein